MQDYQERVVEEKTELDVKIIKLVGFIASVGYVNNVSQEEKQRMRNQLYAMLHYSQILEERIVNF